MKVYNLSKKDLHFRKVVLPANGGSKDFPELDSFIPDNDKRLAEAKVISFGSLPKWWVTAHKPTPVVEAKPVSAVEVMKPSDIPETTVESPEFTNSYNKKKKHQYAQTKE